MALEAKLVQKLSQTLLMTPQLRQAIELLQLGRLEYLDAIERELLENPLLEELKEGLNASNSGNGQTEPQTAAVASEPSTPSPAEPAPEPAHEPEADRTQKEEAKVDWEDYLENFTDSRGAASPKGMIDYEDRPSTEATLSRTETLSEYLVAQVRLSYLSDEQREIAGQIIGNLDKNGYLCASYEEIAAAAKCSVEQVSEVMEVIRSFDPPGVGARDLRECLAIQLQNQGLGDRLEARIVDRHLTLVEKRKFALIAKAEQVAIEEVYKAVTAIKKLEPRPGRPFADDATRYMVSDIYVYKVGSEYVVSLNEDGLPRLRVSPYYLSLLRNEGDSGQIDRQYLSERLKAASWLIKSIHQRQQTIQRVTESIVKFQRDFLDHGVSRLKPLVLKDVADDIGMHESTVSRVTTNKFVHTPQGVFELKYFFTTGLKSADGDVSASAIKERIKAIIASESSDAPISDQGVVEIFKKENINIARRTVAKYREGLGIESSSRRKKLF